VLSLGLVGVAVVNGWSALTPLYSSRSTRSLNRLFRPRQSRALGYRRL